MLKQRPFLILFGLLLLSSLACNAFAGNVEPSLPIAPPVIGTATGTVEGGTAVGIAPTVTLPTDGTAVPGGTGTAVAPLPGPHLITLVDLNVRSGPSVQYDRVGFLLQGESAPITGRDNSSGWWKIQCPANLSTNECWVSGGASYVTAHNTAGVPVAVPPPSPTPPPTATATSIPSTSTVAPAGDSLVAYTDDNGLWVVSVQTNASPPTGSSPLQLSAQSGLSTPLISPDGQKVAFLQQNAGGNVLGYFNTSGHGGDILVASVSLPNSSGWADSTVSISQIAWLPNSQGLAFTTEVISNSGPGAYKQADLWTVTLTGSRQERFTAGNGGHLFAISPDGAKVIFSLPTRLVQANLDGSSAQTLLEFPQINTASEYEYVPIVQWLGNGQTAVTAVPGPDPWQANPSASLYRIQNGNAFASGTVAGNILFNPVQWSHDGNRLGYVRSIVNPANNQSVIVANSNGDSPQLYRDGQNLRFFGWNSANSYFLYGGETMDTFIGIGQVGQAGSEVGFGVGLSDAQWLSNQAFVMVLGTLGSWQLTSGDVLGHNQPLANLVGNFVQMDVWSP